MRRPAIETALDRGDPPAWLLSVSLASGRTLRYATRPLALATASGGLVACDGALQAAEDFAEVADLFALSGVASLTQGSVEIASEVDLAALQADGEAVLGARAELALAYDGQAWEDRRVVLGDAVVQGAELGVAGEVSSLTLESLPPATSAPVGDDDRDLGDDWPPTLLDVAASDMSDVTGSKHVIVLGKPGSVPAYKVGNVGGQNRLVLCGHALPDLGTVTVYEDGVSIGTFTPAVATGTTGKYTYVESATAFGAANGGYTWAASRGGAARIDASNLPTINASDILRWLLSTAAIPVDWRRCERALQRIQSWPAGLYFDQETPAVDAIRNHLLPVLPLVELQSADGLYYAYADADSAPLGTALVAGQNLAGRAGRVKGSDVDAVRNSFTLLYAREESSGTFTGSVSLDADTSAVCYLSRQLLARPEAGDDGTRAADPVESALLWDAVTARRSLRAMAARVALPRRVLAHVSAQDLYWLEAGDAHPLDDAERSISGRRAIVSALSRVSTGIELACVDLTPASGG